MTKPLLSPFAYDTKKALDECKTMVAWLSANDGRLLKETEHLVPEIDTRQNMIASYFHTQSGFIPDSFATRIEIGTRYKCDYAVGDRKNRLLGLVEIESAGPDSLFCNKGRRTTYWGEHAEEGLSQAIDWTYCLKKQMSDTNKLDEFGFVPAGIFCLVVVGRNSKSFPISGPDSRRLEWRSRHAQFDGQSIAISSYDDFAMSLLSSLAFQIDQAK